MWSPCLVTYTPPHKTLPAKMSSNIVQIVQSSRVEHFLEASPQPRCSAAFFGAWQLLAPGQNRLPPNSIYTNENYIRSPMLVCLYYCVPYMNQPTFFFQPKVGSPLWYCANNIITPPPNCPNINEHYKQMLHQKFLKNISVSGNLARFLNPLEVSW